MFLLKDQETDSIIYTIPNSEVFKTSILDSVSDNMDTLWWEKLYSDTGRITRSACWYTQVGCSCNYRYRGKTFLARDFPEWLCKLAKDIADFLKLDKVPNACNFNKYENGSQTVWYHADDEDLFKTSSGATTIVSVSFGATRSFGFKKNYEIPKQAKVVDVHSGDIMVMTGKTQQFWQHAILNDETDEIRYNATFRYISAPHPKCKHCKRNQN